MMGLKPRECWNSCQAAVLSEETLAQHSCDLDGHLGRRARVAHPAAPSIELVASECNLIFIVGNGNKYATYCI